MAVTFLMLTRVASEVTTEAYKRLQNCRVETEVTPGLEKLEVVLGSVVFSRQKANDMGQRRREKTCFERLTVLTLVEDRDEWMDLCKEHFRQL